MHLYYVLRARFITFCVHLYYLKTYHLTLTLVCPTAYEIDVPKSYVQKGSLPLSAFDITLSQVLLPCLQLFQANFMPPLDTKHYTIWCQTEVSV